MPPGHRDEPRRVIHLDRGVWERIGRRERVGDRLDTVREAATTQEMHARPGGGHVGVAVGLFEVFANRRMDRAAIGSAYVVVVDQHEVLVVIHVAIRAARMDVWRAWNLLAVISGLPREPLLDRWLTTVGGIRLGLDGRCAPGSRSTLGCHSLIYSLVRQLCY
jgi:hypothetical protein